MISTCLLQWTRWIGRVMCDLEITVIGLILKLPLWNGWRFFSQAWKRVELLFHFFEIHENFQTLCGNIFETNNQWHGSMPKHCPMYCDVIWKHIPDKQKSDMVWCKCNDPTWCGNIFETKQSMAWFYANKLPIVLWCYLETYSRQTKKWHDMMWCKDPMFSTYTCICVFFGKRYHVSPPFVANIVCQHVPDKPELIYSILSTHYHLCCEIIWTYVPDKGKYMGEIAIFFLISVLWIMSDFSSLWLS